MARQSATPQIAAIEPDESLYGLFELSTSSVETVSECDRSVTSQIFNLECYTYIIHAYHTLFAFHLAILKNPKQLKDPRRELGISRFSNLILSNFETRIFGFNYFLSENISY